MCAHACRGREERDMNKHNMNGEREDTHTGISLLGLGRRHKIELKTKKAST